MQSYLMMRLFEKNFNGSKIPSREQGIIGMRSLILLFQVKDLYTIWSIERWKII